MLILASLQKDLPSFIRAGVRIWPGCSFLFAWSTGNRMKRAFLIQCLDEIMLWKKGGRAAEQLPETASMLMSPSTCREHLLSALTQGDIWILVEEMRWDRKQVSNRLACLSGYWLRIKSKECERCWRGKVWNLKMQGWTQTNDSNKARGSPQNQNAQSIIRSYRVECCVPEWRCWCPVGVPESQCGKGARWTRSWRRSRCPPQQPPCGTPPCPPPDGPPTASAWLAQDRTVLMVRLDIPVTSGSQEVCDKCIYCQYFLHYELHSIYI